MKELKLKKGDRVWVSIPVNATIIRVNKRIGYTLEIDGGAEYGYFDDKDVEKI